MVLSSKIQKGLFLLGSFVVFLLAVLLYSRINQLLRSVYLIDHKNKVELNLEYVMSHLKSAETWHRGFLLTADSSFIQAYLRSREYVDSSVTVVKHLTGDSPDQQQNYASLRNLIDYHYNLFENTLLHRNASPDTFLVNIRRSQLGIGRIQAHIDRMKLVERNQMKTLESRKNLYVKLTPVSLVVLVVATLAIIGFSYYGLTKQLQQTRKSAADLDYANNQLLLKNKQLENSVEELNAFNYIASHDLKEPLRKILFFTDILNAEGQKGKLSPDVQPYIEKIHTSGERMKALLDDLLTYAQAGMMEAKKEAVDLNALLAIVVDNLSERIKEKGASINYKGLPTIMAVPSQMQQLFENLISNSIKYSRENVAPVVTVRNNMVSGGQLPPGFETASEWYHKIRFSDNGIGFTQDNAEKIFVLFQRLHKRHEFSGTGIGLTICRKIVQNHDGFILAESEVSKGTTFTIYLPAQYE